MTPESVRQVRLALAESVPMRNLTDDLIQRVIDRTKDIGVAGDAIAMRPRPAWLELLIGAIPRESE